jgi:hypothetical protein
MNRPIPNATSRRPLADATLAETAHALRTGPRRAPPAPPPLSTLREVPPRLTALVAAVAVALGLLAASVVPARAEGRDVAKAIAAVAAIALIAKMASDSKKRQRQDAHPPAPPPPEVPASCGLRFAGDPAVNYAESCLRRAGMVAPLPATCAMPVTLAGRPDRIYREPCLIRSGLRIDPRR